MSEMRDALTMFRGLVTTWQAGRRYRRAVLLHHNGNLAKACLVAQEALELLRQPSVARTSPPVLTILLAATALLAKVAPSSGAQVAANAAMQEALELCRLAIAQQPRMAEWDHLRTHMVMFDSALQ
jgi:uncharacterized membrane protein